MTENTPSKRTSRASYSLRNPLYTVIGQEKGPVLRRPMTPEELSSPSSANSATSQAERDKRFAELLLDLQESYGIRSPNMSMYQDGPTVFIEGQWVEGKNLSDEPFEIPEPVVRQAVEAIIQYYRNVALEGGDYIADLRPSNIIYGRMAEDTEDHLYFIDLEPLGGHAEPHHPLPETHMNRLLPELWLLIGTGVNSGRDWQDLVTTYLDFVDLVDREG